MKGLTPLKAIRAKCVDCCCGNKAEVRRCPTEKCPLHPYRMGHRPKGSKATTPDEFSENIPENPEAETGDKED